VNGFPGVDMLRGKINNTTFAGWKSKDSDWLGIALFG